MKLRPLLISSLTASCALLAGCAADLDDGSTARVAPDEPFALTIDGVGDYAGRAEYEVSEPAEGFAPTPRLVLRAQAPASSVVLRLGQQAPGDIAEDYDFPALENAFLVELDGKAFEGRFGEVRLAVDGKLEGEFELESADIEGADQIMLRGSFSADRLFLNCNRLADEKSEGARPGQTGDGSDDLIWEPDTHLESAFCNAMRDRLGALYGG